MAADARSQKRGRGKGSHGAVFTCIATPKKGQRAPQCFAESIYWLCWRTDGTRSRPLPTGDRLGRQPTRLQTGRDRKSVGMVQSVSGRVDLGGRHDMKKKKNN